MDNQVSGNLSHIMFAICCKTHGSGFDILSNNGILNMIVETTSSHAGFACNCDSFDNTEFYISVQFISMIVLYCCCFNVVTN